MQDPTNRNIVFAGTTEGLWRTVDSGATWQRTTGPEVIINDVFVDPTNTNRVMLATDRGGVLASNDGGNSFVQSNTGFSARQITSYLADGSNPATIYVGVVNDKALGGVFASTNGGLNWSQMSSGLNGHDVFSLVQGPDNNLLAGTRHGIYRLAGGCVESRGQRNLQSATSAAGQSWKENDGCGPLLRRPRTEHQRARRIRLLRNRLMPSKRRSMQLLEEVTRSMPRPPRGLFEVLHRAKAGRKFRASSRRAGTLWLLEARLCWRRV